MPILTNTRHERFAQLVAGGMSATQAYGEAGYSRKDADASGPRLRAKEAVAGRIRELQSETASRLSMSRHELGEFLIQCILTPAGEVTPEHRLCQSHEVTRYGEVKMKIPDKLSASAQLARLCGWNEAEKPEASGDGLERLMAAIRARR